MSNLLAFDLVQSLQPEEAVGFRSFLKSEQGHHLFKADHLELLFDILYQYSKTENTAFIEKEVLYEKVFPGKPFVKNKVEKLASDLNTAIRQYLLMQRYFSEENDMQRQLDWLVELRKRALTNRHQQAWLKVKKQLEFEAVESLDQYWFKFLLEKEQHDWLSEFNPKSDMNIPASINQLDQFYYAYRTEGLNRLNLISKQSLLEKEASTMVALPWVVPDDITRKGKLVQILNAIYTLLQSEAPSVEGFQMLLDQITVHEQQFDESTLKGFYAYVRNFCVLLIDSGRNEFTQLMHEIQKQNLDQGYFYFDGKIPPASILNIIKIGIKVGEVEWSKNMVENHKDRILGDNEDRDYYRLMLSICYFGEKTYEQAIEVLPLASTNPTFYLMARRIELKVYYEMQSDLLSYKMDAFRMFMRRTGQKTYPVDVYEQYINFVNFIRQLYLSSGVVDRERSKKLVERIQAKRHVAERSWLLEKAVEIGRRKV